MDGTGKSRDGKRGDGTPRRASPRRLRATHEAADAIRIADHLVGLLTPQRAAVLLTQLAPYRRRLFHAEAGNPLAGVDGLPPARQHELAMRLAAPVLLDVLLPACRDHLLDRLAVPEAATDDAPGNEDADEDDGLPSVVEVAGAMRTMIGALRGGGRQHATAVVAAVEQVSRAMVKRAATAETPAGTARGVTMLSHTLLRLEALRLMLETLGARGDALGDVAYQSRRVARLALRHAAGTLNNYLDSPNLAALHGSLLVISAVDGLIVVALRILDALEGQEEEETPFVKVADEVALDTYVEAATRLAQVLIRLGGKALLADELDSLLFAAMLRKIKWLHRFCARLGNDHSRRPAAIDELADYIVLQSAMLARRAGEWLTDTCSGTPDPATAHRRIERAEAVADLLTEMNRRHVQDALEARIAAVRATLAPPSPDPAVPQR